MSKSPRTVRMSIMVKPETAEALRVAAFEEREKIGPLIARWLEEMTKTDKPTPNANAA